MIKIPIKPLSVNQSYTGRRFSTPALKQYKKDLSMILPRINIPEGKLKVEYVFGVSSQSSDGDNLIKAFQDSISECYGFNDKMIYEWYVKKEIVPKGSEYIEFSITPVDN